MGFRTSYNLTQKVNVAYWLVNGAQQTEDFNGLKSQAFIFTLKPSSTVSWNVNYYFGEEQPDVVPILNPGFPTGPTQPGLLDHTRYPYSKWPEHTSDTYLTLQCDAEADVGGRGRLCDQPGVRALVSMSAAALPMPVSETHSKVRGRRTGGVSV